MVQSWCAKVRSLSLAAALATAVMACQPPTLGAPRGATPTASPAPPAGTMAAVPADLPLGSGNPCRPASDAAAPQPTEAPAADAAGGADWRLSGGWFYSQGSGSPTTGYSIVDDAQASFWSQYLALGGWRVLGFPISRRFMLDGKLSQATQRALLQWSPVTGRVELANVLDLLHERQRDEILADQEQIPRITAVDQVNRDYATIIAMRLAWLEARPAIKQRYCDTPGGADPITLWGLPTSTAVDVSGTGAVYVMRTQRAAFQEWVDGLSVEGVTVAAPGQVTVVLAGILATKYGLIPCTALSPETAPIPSPGMPVPGTVLFCDDFEDPNQGRLPRPPVADPSPFDLTYEGGEYVIRKLDPSWDRIPNALLPERYADASISFAVRLVGDARGRHVAVACRDTEEHGHYRLTLEPDSRRFRLSRVAPDGQAITLTDWETSAAIRPANETNRIELSCAGEVISATVNDVLLASATDPDSPLREGQLWIGVGAFPGAHLTAEARFDRLVVKQQ